MSTKQDRNRRLFAIKGVVGVGTSFDGEIRVYVISEHAAKNVPEEIDGIPITVEVTGEIRALGQSQAEEGEG